MGPEFSPGVMASVAPSARTLWPASVAVIGFGVVLRLLGFFDLEVSADKEGWCPRLIDGAYGWICPIGCLWLTRELLTLHVVEQVLRDWLPSHFVTKCGAFGKKSWRSLVGELGGRSFRLVSAKSKMPLETRKRLSSFCEAQVDELLPEWTLLYRCRAEAGVALSTPSSLTEAEPEGPTIPEPVDDDP